MREYFPRLSPLNAKCPSAPVFTDCATSRSVPWVTRAMATRTPDNGCPVRAFTTMPLIDRPEGVVAAGAFGFVDEADVPVCGSCWANDAAHSRMAHANRAITI